MRIFSRPTWIILGFFQDLSATFVSDTLGHPCLFTIKGWWENSTNMSNKSGTPDTLGHLADVTLDFSAVLSE